MRFSPGRYRSRAIRAIGLPNLPNAPSVRALAQRQLRNAGLSGSPSIARQTSSGGPSSQPKADRKPTLVRHVVAWFTILMGLYLLIASCFVNVPDVPCPQPNNSYGHSHCKEK